MDTRLTSRLCLVFSVIVFAVSTQYASALPITYEFAGHVLGFSKNEAQLFDEYGIKKTATFHGRFTYDPTLPATRTSESTGSANYSLQNYSLTFSSGGHFMAADHEASSTPLIQVINDHSIFNDWFAVYSGQFRANEEVTGGFQFRLQDKSNSVFDSSSIPTILDLSTFTNTTQGFSLVRTFNGVRLIDSLVGRVTSLVQVEAVPIPGSLGLMLTGMMAIGFVRVRKHIKTGKY